MNPLFTSSAWPRSLLLALGLAVSGYADDDKTLPLPRWSEDELKSMSPAGPLSAFNPLLNPYGDNDERAPLNLADSPDSAQPRSDLSLFLPPSLMASMRQERPKASAAVTLVRVLRDVSPDYMEQAIQAPPGMLLIDPNGELHESAHEEFQHFLEFHARDSRIVLRVMLMGKNEQLPPDTQLSALANGAMQQGRACVVVVPHGDMERARLFLSQDLVQAAKGIDLTELLSDAVNQAKSSPESDEQLHRLLVRLSVRLFWLEHKLPSPLPNETVRPAIIVADAPAPMLEVGVPSKWSLSVPSLLGLGLGFGALGVFMNRRWIKHKRRTHEWTLPEMKSLDPSLGGAHCGGAVGVAWS